MAERILYLPSVGYCLLIGLGVGRLIESTKNSTKPNSSLIISKSVRLIHQNNSKSNSHNSNNYNNNINNHGKISGQRKRQIILVVFSVLLMVYSVKTVQRNFDWKDEESLFRSAIGINAPKGKRSFKSLNYFLNLNL